MSARTCLIWLLIAFASGAVLFAQSSPATTIKWAPDIAAAKQASAQYKVPVMIHFYGDGCTPCRTLEKNVFTNPEVISTLNSYFICVSINGTRDRQSMAEFGVHSYPTDVFLSPTGEKIYQEICQQDVRNYLGTLERVAVMNRDRNMVAAAKKENNNSAAAQQAITTTGQLASASTSDSRLPTLPPPGFNNPSTAAQSGFYLAQGAQIAQQQLPLGASSNSYVQSGPLQGVQQPVSITGSTPQLQHHLGAALSSAAPQFNDANSQRPKQSTTDNPAVPQLNRLGAPMASYAQVASTVGPSLPTIPNQALDAYAAKASSTADRWNTSVAQVTTTVQNPHFHSAVAANAATNSLPISSAPTPSAPALSAPTLSAPKLSAPTLSAPALSAPTLPPVAVTTPSTMTSGVTQPTSPAWPLSLAASPQPTITPTVTLASQSTNANTTNAVASQFAGVAASASTNQPVSATDNTRLATAIDGFCPVSLRAKQWKKGLAEYSAQHRGMYFQMADEASLNEFLRNPDHFSPLLLGNDPMVLLNQGRMVPGSVQYGLFEDRFGALFFTSAESKTQFHANFERNMLAIEKILQRAAVR